MEHRYVYIGIRVVYFGYASRRGITPTLFIQRAEGYSDTLVIIQHQIPQGVQVSTQL